MDTSKEEHKPLTIQHCYWLGLKNENGALVRKGMEGEVQIYKGKFYYCENNKAVKTLITRKDLDDIIIPILNAEIDERNKKRKELEEYNKTLEKKVKERTKELEEKNEQLEKFNKMAIGRELKMTELKKRINELEGK